MTFDLDISRFILPRFSATSSILTIASIIVVKDIATGCRSHEENVAKVAGATSNEERFLYFKIPIDLSANKDQRNCGMLADRIFE